MSEISMDILKNIMDVYLTDWKYWNNECAERLSKVKNYLEIIRRNHDLAFKDSKMVIRHLVLPNHFECCTKNILKYISDNYGEKVIVNIMDQICLYGRRTISRYFTKSYDMELKKQITRGSGPEFYHAYFISTTIPANNKILKFICHGMLI
jgi:uncharacterized Fe-S radical SAM superfamily protein PflX